MIDLFALGVTHLLLVLALWRLVQRDDLDQDPPTHSEPEEPAVTSKKGTLRA
jgi:hypothetical protein